MFDEPERDSGKLLNYKFVNAVLSEGACRGCHISGGHDLYVSLDPAEDPEELAADVDGIEFAHEVNGMAKFDYVDSGTRQEHKPLHEELDALEGVSAGEKSGRGSYYAHVDPEAVDDALEVIDTRKRGVHEAEKPEVDIQRLEPSGEPGNGMYVAWD